MNAFWLGMIYYIFKLGNDISDSDVVDVVTVRTMTTYSYFQG